MLAVEKSIKKVSKVGTRERQESWKSEVGKDGRVLKRFEVEGLDGG